MRRQSEFGFNGNVKDNLFFVFLGGFPRFAWFNG